MEDSCRSFDVSRALNLSAAHDKTVYTGHADSEQNGGERRNYQVYEHRKLHRYIWGKGRQKLETKI